MNLNFLREKGPFLAFCIAGIGDVYLAQSLLVKFLRVSQKLSRCIDNIARNRGIENIVVQPGAVDAARIINGCWTGCDLQ